MDNTGRAICEVLLVNYNNLERECIRLDVKANQTARRSRDINIYDAIDEMTRITNQKIACVNAKVIIDKCLDTLPNTVELRKYYIKQSKRIPSWNERVEEKKEQLFKAILKKYSTRELLNLIMDSQWLMTEVRRKKKQLDKANEEEKGHKA